MLIGVLVHPIDTIAHPTIPKGYRWAVHVGNNWTDPSTCLNAGWEAERGTAAMVGEAHAVCAAKVGKRLGAATELRTFFLDHDPIPAGRDQLSVGV